MIVQQLLITSLFSWFVIILNANSAASLKKTVDQYADSETDTYHHLIERNRSLTTIESNEADSDAVCDKSTLSNALFKRYFDGMDAIYSNPLVEQTCLPVHKSCGWPHTSTAATSAKKSKLPLFVMSVGLEGAGHHLWTEIMGMPVFDCVWINGRHYNRNIGDGVARSTVDMLQKGFLEQFDLRKAAGKAPCKSIYDAEDSFPTGSIRKNGRVFMRPDIVNLQKLDGVLFNVKYLLILRNTTDTALSALRRNFFSNVDYELRTVEHTLTYIEAAMRGIPCHKVFIAHYEHVLTDPHAFFEPLAQFLELDSSSHARQSLKKRLANSGKVPSRKAHKLTQFSECSGLSENDCYHRIATLLDDFFNARGFMWPTFAADGFKGVQ